MHQQKPAIDTITLSTALEKFDQLVQLRVNAEDSIFPTTFSIVEELPATETFPELLVVGVAEASDHIIHALI